MAGSCEACRASITVTQKRIKSNTPVRDTLKPAKETLQVNVPKGGVAISLPVSPPVIRETPTTSMDTVGIETTLGSITAGHTTPMSDNTTILSQIENLLDDKTEPAEKRCRQGVERFTDDRNTQGIKGHARKI
ncbi:hypothetical protein ACJJTC_008223 [Scirpophaga incertulas]